METSKTTLASLHQPDVKIRHAGDADVQDIHNIYNHYVSNSVATFAISEEALEDRHVWFQIHQQNRLPILVAENQSGKILGWASLSTYSTRCAYKNTVETSVYLDSDYLGRGYGSKLLDAIIKQAAEKGYHCMVALICTENDPSVKLFRSRNFEEVGILKEVGFKFERWLDVIILQKLNLRSDSY
jgi:phosphinothricin acetyltransferase